MTVISKPNFNQERINENHHILSSSSIRRVSLIGPGKGIELEEAALTTTYEAKVVNEHQLQNGKPIIHTSVQVWLTRCKSTIILVILVFF